MRLAKPGNSVEQEVDHEIRAAETVRFWCDRRIARGRNCATDAQILEARAWAAAVEDSHNGGQVPGFREQSFSEWLLEVAADAQLRKPGDQPAPGG